MSVYSEKSQYSAAAGLRQIFLIVCFVLGLIVKGVIPNEKSER